MKKILFFCILLILPSLSFASYKLENGSSNLVKKYHFSTKNLNKQVTRKEFIETLAVWYKDYKAQKGIVVNYDNFKKLDNNIYFQDIDLHSNFGKKVSYFVGLGAFSKRKYFDPNGKVPQRDYFTVMKRLKIMYGMRSCRYLQICEREINKKTPFTKGTYYKYTSKILDRTLRKYANTPKYYLENGYKPYLSPSYHFPLKRQTLNGCYAFSVRNIFKYKYGIGMYIPRSEKIIQRSPKKLWNKKLINAFNRVNHVQIQDYKTIDSLIHLLQSGEPVSITYWLKYYSWKDKKEKKVLHIVAAYSFDEKGVWVSETVSGQRKRIAWKDVFNRYGTLGGRRMIQYEYIPKKSWNQKQKDFEKKHNLLVGEF